ncbi:retrotransposon protein, putative, ty1-copia subclass, partial [Tanacetum coccineum]
PSTSFLDGVELSLVAVEILWNEMKGARIVVKGGGDLWEYTASKSSDGCAFVCLVAKGGDRGACKVMDNYIDENCGLLYITIRVTNVTSLINLRVAFHAINARRLPLAPLVYTLVRPSMTTSSANNSVFRGFFEKQKLTRPNFIDWYRQLRIVLSIEDKLNYLEQPLPPALVGPEGQLELKLCLLSKQNRSFFRLREIFTLASRKKGMSLILISLRKEFDSFVQNYNIHSMGKTVNELHAMLKLHEQTLPKNNTPALHAIRAGKVQKGNKHKKPQPQLAARGQNQGKGKNKLAYAPKPKIPPPPKRENPAKDSICHECGETGHQKRNYPQYLAELLKRKNTASGASGSGVACNKARKKRIKKLQHDRLLNSTDLRAFEKCISCMSGKMARKPYTHQVERAKDLLGLIHTNVCGPFKIMSRQGASYFFSFTDDFSRYGYVYLLKHKHEMFETFKVFQKEVENQLSKTIKSLRSNHGGEYMSQEFLDHLKDYGIVAHRTPSYAPQHNGVSERRNRTLIDMVRSMISQTTLPKSFWDYALETTACILNMVLTKKVEKTPYEVWHGSTRKRNAPNHMCLYIDAEEHKLGDLGELANYKAALLDTDKTVGSKWLFKKKTNIDGAVHTYKARLVAKGYTQTSRIDYVETFSPIADIRAIRILIAISAFYDYEIWQMDVKTAFLNRYLSKEVYMEQPKGFVNPKYPNRECKLKRSIYGLKQASR